MNGGHISRDEAQWLFNLEESTDIFDLLSWANRIREHFKGNKIHLCSIVNAKAGACSENCSFCAQSSFYQTGSPKYGFIDPEPVMEAARLAVTMRRTRAGHIDRLRSSVDPSTPLLYVPYLFMRAHGFRTTRQVAEALSAELSY